MKTKWTIAKLIFTTTFINSTTNANTEIRVKKKIQCTQSIKENILKILVYFSNTKTPLKVNIFIQNKNYYYHQYTFVNVNQVHVFHSH